MKDCVLSDGIITITSDADFKVSVSDVYILNVTVSDSRYTSDVYPLFVQLDWRNRAPQFNLPQYRITMKENSTQVITVSSSYRSTSNQYFVKVQKDLIKGDLFASKSPILNFIPKAEVLSRDKI